MGMRRHHRRRHSHRGGSILGNVWNGVKKVAGVVGPTLLPILKEAGVKLVRSKLGLGRRHRRGRSLFSSSASHYGCRRRRSHRGGLVMTPSRLGSLVRSSLMGSRKRHRRGGYASAPFVATHGMRRRRRSHRVGSARMIMGALRRSMGMRIRRTRRGRHIGMRRHRRRLGRGPFGSILGSVLGHVLPF